MNSINGPRFIVESSDPGKSSAGGTGEEADAKFLSDRTKRQSPRCSWSTPTDGFLHATLRPRRRSGRGGNVMQGRFSRRTVIAATDVLNLVLVQSATSAFLIELGRRYVGPSPTTRLASQSECRWGSHYQAMCAPCVST